MKSSRLPWLLPILIVVAGLTAYGEASISPSPLSAMAVREIHIRALAPRQGVPAATGNPFSVALAEPASPAEPPGAVPPAPSLPPPLPWRVIGKQYDEQQGWAVFLARGEETRIVRLGDILDETYRVASIQPPVLTLQHLKRRTRQTLDIGEAKE